MCLVLIVHFVYSHELTVVVVPSSLRRIRCCSEIRESRSELLRLGRLASHKRPAPLSLVHHARRHDRANSSETRITSSPLTSTPRLRSLSSTLPYCLFFLGSIGRLNLVLHSSILLAFRLIWSSQPASGGPSPDDSVPHRLPQKCQRGTSGRRHSGRDRVPEGEDSDFRLPNAVR